MAGAGSHTVWESENPSLSNYKYYMIKTARELFYPEDVIIKIEKAEKVVQIDQIMRQARKDFM